MRKLISNTALVAIAAGGMLFASCGDHDMFNPNYKAEEYAANWEQKIGAVDPNQDWSMATKVTAKANVPNADGSSIMRIFSVGENQQLLCATSITNGKGEVSFDVQKGSNEVFVTVLQGNKYIFSGIIGIDNGIANITPNAKRAKTRAGENCPVTKGNVLFTHTGWDIEERWDGETHVMNSGGWYGQVKQEGNEYFVYYSKTPNGPYKKILKNGLDKPDWNPIHGYVNADLYDEEGNKVTNLGYFYGLIKDNNGVLEFVYPNPYYTHQSYPAKFYTLNNQTTSEVTWRISDCKALFWEDDAFFKEGDDYRCGKKKALYESQGKKVADMEHGVVYTTKAANSQISIPMVYGATLNGNIFGYYYYTDGQDSRAVNRYVLYEDAQPSTNIKVDGKAVGNMDLQQMQSTWTDNSIVTCTNRRLVYFGEDGEGTPTYDFPANVHIGFFITSANTPDIDGVTGEGTHQIYATSFAYSDPVLNKRYFNVFQAWDKKVVTNNQTALKGWSYRGSKDNSISPDNTRGNVKAITWEYNGKKFMGFGDDSGDCDLNDFVCWIDGDFKEEAPIKIITNDIVTKSQSWILACEDLGSTDDYDFNDIVLEITKVDEIEQIKEDGELVKEEYKGSKLVVKCLAAGGTLPATIYYDNNMIGEAHAMLGESNTGKMINTTTITNTPIEYVIDKSIDQNWTLSENKDKFKIVVNSNDNMAALIEAPADGEAPQMIIVPGDWQWPTERAHIEEAYPDFKSWNSNASLTDWNNAKVADKVIKR